MKIPLASRTTAMCAITASLVLLMTGSLTLAGKSVPTIRDMDFRNFSYAPSCLSNEQRVHVRNGSFYGHTRGGSDGYDFLDLTIEQLAFGRLSPDGREQAVVVTRCNTGGSGAWTEASVFEMRNGKPALVTALQGGDRADGGIANVGIKNGLLRVDYYETTGGSCCPEWVDTATYRLVDRRLVEVGRRVRKASLRIP